MGQERARKGVEGEEGGVFLGYIGQCKEPTITHPPAKDQSQGISVIVLRSCLPWSNRGWGVKERESQNLEKSIPMLGSYQEAGVK